MATRDDLLATLESIHAAGLDEREWPAALSAVTHLLGAVAATFEEFRQDAAAASRLSHLRSAAASGA
jgi:hypothetical protein